MQDDIRITPTLTMNAGLRYEISPPMTDIRNQMSSIDFSTVPSPETIFATGQTGVYSPKFFVCGKDGYPDACAYTNRKNFSPRLGLAWSLDSKTVIRAGGGIYYGTQDGNPLLKLAQSLPTTYNQTLTFNAYVPSVTLANVFGPAVVGSAAITGCRNRLAPGDALFPAVELEYAALNHGPHYVEAGYLGTAGIHLEQNVQINNSMPGTAVKRALLRIDAGSRGAIRTGSIPPPPT